MNSKELRSLSKDDRQKRMTEVKKELIKLNGQVATGTAPKSPGQIRQLKRTIARLLTIENQEKGTSTEAK